MVSTNQTEESLGVEVSIQCCDILLIVSQTQVSSHRVAIEVVGVVAGEECRHVANDLHVDPVMRSGVGEDLVHHAAGSREHCLLVSVAAQCVILEKGPADQAAHGMRHKIETKRLSRRVVFAADAVSHSRDQPPQTDCIVLDLRPHAWSQLFGHLIVIPIYEHRTRLHVEPHRHLFAALIHITVAVLLHQAHKRRLEVQPLDNTVPPLSDFR